MRGYLGEVLNERGYRCVCFEESAAVLAHMSQSEPRDLVLSDISMPGMSGLELLRIVKAITPDTPFIILSGLYNLASAFSALHVRAIYPD